jgi:hypothetical protein
LEAGRGVGGSAFMNLTGRDPDVASNLLPIVLVGPEMSNAAGSQDTTPVTLRVQIDGRQQTVLEESTSPDQDYFWLDLIWKAPVFLTKGTHTLRYSAASGERSKIDAFYIQPAVAQRSFILPDGRTVQLTYNTLSGESSWNESQTF